MHLPDSFIDQDKPERMYEQAGLDAKGIVEQTLTLFRNARKIIYNEYLL
jgi:1-deoxy-D-xylulose-5-phosphate synthase